MKTSLPRNRIELVQTEGLPTFVLVSKRIDATFTLKKNSAESKSKMTTKKTLRERIWAISTAVWAKGEFSLDEGAGFSFGSAPESPSEKVEKRFERSIILLRLRFVLFSKFPVSAACSRTTGRNTDCPECPQWASKV